MRRETRKGWGGFQIGIYSHSIGSQLFNYTWNFLMQTVPQLINLCFSIPKKNFNDNFGHYIRYWSWQDYIFLHNVFDHARKLSAFCNYIRLWSLTRIKRFTDLYKKFCFFKYGYKSFIKHFIKPSISDSAKKETLWSIVSCTFFYKKFPFEKNTV